MAVFLLLLLCCFVLSNIEGDCSSIKADYPISYSAALKCINSVEFQDDIRTQTLESVRLIYQNYVYRDNVKNSGPPFNIEVDIQSLLNDIEKRDDYQSDYEFHADLSSAFLRLYDPHTVYIPPMCYSTFQFYFPFKIRRVGDEYFVEKFSGRDKTITTSYEHLFLNSYNQYSGIRIESIEDRPPGEYLEDLAREKNFFSRDAGVRLNNVLKESFHKRSLTRSPMPVNNLKIHVENATHSETLTVEWMVIPSLDYSELDMETICGYSKPEEDSEEIRRSTGRFWRGIKDINVNLIAKYYEDRFLGKYSLGSDPERRSFENEYRQIALENTLGGKLEYLKLYRKYNSDIAVLVVTTFMPDVMNSEATVAAQAYSYYTLQMNEAFEKMAALGMTKVVVDVRGNSGGIGCLGIVLARFLSQYTPLDPSPNSEAIVTDLGKYLHCPTNYLDKLNFFTQDRRPVSDNWFVRGKVRLVNGNSSLYSQMVHFGCQMTYFLSQQEYFWENSPKHFEPEDIIILTDGTCGSTCGVFIKIMQYLKLARVVSHGGITGKEMNIASYKGAAVKSLNSTLDELALMSIMCPDVNKVKLKRLPGTAMFTYSWLRLYAWDPPESTYYLGKVDDKTPIGFTRRPADIHVDSWEYSGDIYNSILPYFYQCAPWMIQKSKKCNIISKPLVVAGFPCNASTGKFDRSAKCQIRGCVSGFFYDQQKRDCVAMPEEYNVMDDVQVVLIFAMLAVYGVMLVIIYASCLCFCLCLSITCRCIKVDKSLEERERELPNVKYNKLNNEEEDY